MDRSPRELLLELAIIERELGSEITDPDILHILEHGGVVDGAKKVVDSIIARVNTFKELFIPSSNNNTEEIISEQHDTSEEDIKRDHKEPTDDIDLSDPLHPPFEPTFPPNIPNPHNHQWIFNPVNRCKRDRTEFLILIKITEESYAIRDIIRKTWCKEIELVTCIFLLGRDTSLEKYKVKAEYNAYKDIVMEDIDGKIIFLNWVILIFPIHVKIATISIKLSWD